MMSENQDYETSPLLHMIPPSVLRPIYAILDAGDTWESDLVPHMPDIALIDVDGCKRYKQEGKSPTELLFRIWASKGYTALHLYQTLALARIVRCMALLRDIVDEKYHSLENCDSSNNKMVDVAKMKLPQNSNNSSIKVQQEATNNFSSENVIGKGGYGIVYRGEMQHATVAIKRIIASSDKSGKRLRQSLQELRTLAKFRHDNILPLYAFSLEGPEPCLVYQFMANGSLEDRILCRNKSAPLTWPQKRDIAEGAARGLFFLHTFGKTPIIHGDVKTANILLDKHLEPKLGDFGLSRDGQIELNAEEKTPLIASHIKGTLAYLPPEFITQKILSTKLDVYSFGIVLLEIATGSRAYVDSRAPHSLVDYCISMLEKNREKPIAEILGDKKTPPTGDKESDTALIERLVQLGLLCSKKEKMLRPRFNGIIDVITQKIDVKTLSSQLQNAKIE
ncbi:hypothetical protein WR25_20875 [Diploscapter pachys]|uniref:non-specific serine/threonine protein kinase n=1 Tax=Diploscapter pachys TaxID=2018661 RepID=A0A2A2JPH0_9BILA|nr:hypothetical protein WR25_20875 [Diploscapter pachys]